MIWSSIASGQDEPTSAPQEAPTPSAQSNSTLTREQRNASQPAAIQSDIETLYVRDSAGELVPVLNMSFEDFQRLYRLDRKLTIPQRPPAYSLEQMSIDGTAIGRRAELTMSFEAKLLREGFARIPLRLQRAVLTNAVQYTGDGEHVLSAPDPKGGFVWWVKGAAGSTHKITLSAHAPLAVVGKESQLSLSLPRATASQLKVAVAGRNTPATIFGDGQLLRRKMLEKRRTQQTVVGLGGEFKMVWGASPKPATRPKLIEATGDIQVQVKGPGVVSTTAGFRVSSSGRDMDSVKIRLPRNARPILVEDANFAIEYISTSEGKNAAGTGAPIAIVRFNEPTRGPVDFQLSVTQTKSLDAESEEGMNVLDFEVIDAVSHSGTVSLQADGDWLVRWQDAGLRRIAGGETLVAANLVAVFEYYRQPAKLPIRIYQKETRVSVEPTYLIDVQANQATLDAVLRFRVRGAPTSFILCDLSGWQVTNVGDPALIREDAIRMNEVAPLEIPLETARRGDFTLKLRAIRKLAAAEKDERATPLQLRLPSFPNANLAPAIVVVNPADNLTLTGSATTNAFDAEPLPENLTIPKRERAPRCYLFRGDPASTPLEYDIKRREQSINVDIQNEIKINEDIATIIQDFTYQVRYEPLEVIRLHVPRELARMKSLRILLNGEEVDIEAIAKSDRRNVDESAGTPSSGILPSPELNNNASDDSQRIWDIRLPQPKLGRIYLQLSYVMPGSEAQIVDDTTRWACFFTSPGVGNQRRIELKVQPPADCAAELMDAKPWTQTNSAADQSSPQVLQVAAANQPARVNIGVRRVVFEQAQSIVVERVFVQSWLSSRQRQDRATFLLSAATSPIQVQLPPGADQGSVYVLVNGKTVQPTVENTSLSIDLPSPRSSNVRLEIAYPFNGRPTVGFAEMKMAAIKGANWIRELYWQVVTPSNEHLIWSSDRFALHNQWKPGRYSWERRPEFTQSELESWIGATPQSQPPASCNTYLFAGFGESRSLALRTAKRRSLLAVGSGLYLAMYFFWIWTPVDIRRLAMLPIMATLVIVALLNPGLAVLVCQAAALGVALAGLTHILQWLLPASRPISKLRPVTTNSQTITGLAPATGAARPNDSLSMTMPTAE